MKKIMFVLPLVLLACQGPKGDTGRDAVLPSPSPVTPEVEAVRAVLAEENAYRQLTGQSELTEGLSCSVYKFVTPSNPTTIYATTNNSNKVGTTTTALTFTLRSEINQPDTAVTDGMSVMPQSVRNNPAFQSWYLLRCTGYLVVTEANYYTFELQGDDGVILSLQGSQVINLDGQHGVQTATASKLLRKGVHAFKLEYLQTHGNQALVLKAGGQVINPMYTVH